LVVDALVAYHKMILESGQGVPAQGGNGNPLPPANAPANAASTQAQPPGALPSGQPQLPAPASTASIASTGDASPQPMPAPPRTDATVSEFPPSQVYDELDEF
jgi:hypothetical protein